VRIEHADVAIVGAGPAGLAAAVEAARAGLNVVLVDENPSFGGQIWRRLPAEFAESLRSESTEAPAQRLFAAVSDLKVRCFFSTTVWGAFGKAQLEAAGPDGPFRICAPNIILAVGAHDRPVALPGWTLPGVMTVGGAQVLLKGQKTLPQGRVLLAGTGPLLLVVAAQYARAGADIVAVAESASSGSLLRHIPALLGSPGLMLRGASYRLSLALRLVPWHARTIVLRIEGRTKVEAAVLATLDPQGQIRPGSEWRVACDMVLLGYGLVPALELPRLLACAMTFDAVRKSFTPDRSDEFETSQAGVFAIGDGAGVAGAVVAAEEGRVAGVAVARRQGRLSADEARSRQEASRRRLKRLHSFRIAMDEVYRPPDVLAALAEPDTVLCRCEDVTSAQVDSAVADGACEAAQVKLWTRAGMGPCQGRMCHLSIVSALSRATGKTIAQIGPYGVRAPVKPLDVRTLLRME
jgi:NADPH-dependent 2,4-dienoyl-CoA reductase/sulfur reductase-like enzyme